MDIYHDVKLIPTEKLKPYKNNPKKHPQKQIDKLKKSIKEFGFTVPLIIGKDLEVVAGHGRLIASKQLGIEELPCIKRTDLTEEQMKAFRIADNKLTESEWNEEALNLELNELSELDIDIDLTGFSKEEIKDITKEQEKAEEDEYDIKEGLKNVERRVKKGEVWKLGDHRLMCGDATNEEDVKELVGDRTIKTIFTSPPYNMNAEMYKDYSDNLKSEKYIEFNLNTIQAWKKYLKGYIFWNISYNKNTRHEFLEIMNKIIKEANLKFLELIVWNKKTASPIKSKEMLTRTYEPILMVGDEEQVKKEVDLLWFGTTKQRAHLYKTRYTGTTNYWEVRPNKIQLENLKACFPVELPAKGIIMTTTQHDTIADPFGGSGTTLIASEQLNRKCLMMEIDPEYCNVIIDRWEKYTDKIAEKITN